ncbi:elongation factor 1-delta-like isoform X3 [Toxorhynchites rutilus septentrionalis]|uniref:elongation factor 1-delta-like isoform X3 n=1 Tax=Toxorhynchites rutilus septentrionalis TaxID=329112 RepID=UPI0024783B81|nr:elongation factor 1-delta-like isoform X3 [Toxorhynchites rutilus septentrionalis]
MFYLQINTKVKSMASYLACEKHWAEKPNYDDAEKKYYEYLAQHSVGESRKHSICPNITQKSVASQVQPKPEMPKMEQSSPAPAAAATINGEQSKVKKERKRNRKNKKDTSQSPDPVMPVAIVVPPNQQVVAPQPVIPVATEEASQEQAKKKAKKSKKNKASQEAAAETVIGNTTCPATNNTILTEKSQQENTKNLKEKENLAHKLCGNITEEINKMDGIAALAASPGAELLDRLSTVEKENEKLRSVIDGLNKLVIDLHERVKSLETGSMVPVAPKAAAPAPAKKAPAPANEDEDDDDVDLFGSDDESEDKAAAELREKRLADYAAKKSKKPALIAKSNIILDIKPWDDETDMKLMEQEVRKISTDGLLLGASKLVPLAYGIHKLQISCVIEDDKVSVDWLQEEIEKIEDYVQSVDIAAFNKI